MVFIGLSKSIKQPIASVALFALITVGCPTPLRAQLPGSTPVAPAPTENNQPVQVDANLQADVDYTLGGGDRIRISVFDVPEYSGEYQVPPGGDLYLPLVGRVRIRGLTQEQAAEAIGARYARFLKRPLVTVSLISPRPINVVVSGEVNRPGSFTVGLQGGAGDNPGVQYPTAIGAIALAEGVTLAADIGQVQLRRRQGTGAEQVINVDLRQLINSGNSGQDITLRDGDTVFVPTATSVNLAEIRQFSTSNFASPPTAPRTVTVIGQVNRPGAYVVIGGATAGNTTLTSGGTITQGSNATSGLPTVTRAIQLAGGITSLADVRNVQIRRLTKTGPVQTINVNLWELLQTGDANQDTLVQTGDTIVIPAVTTVNAAEQTQIASTNFSPDTIQVSVVGEVKAPGLVRLRPNTPLNEAVLNAGGFNDSRARRKDVELIRLNPDGTVTKRKIKIDFAQSISDVSNPTLRNNDIVIVSRSGIAKVGDAVGTVLGPVGGILSVIGIFGL